MSRRVAIAIGASIIVLFFPVSRVDAKRVLPQFAPKQTSSSPATKTRGVTVTARFRSDRKGINVTFSNLSVAAAVQYSLSYVANGVEQGVDGSVNVALGTFAKELIFGTCSSGVCRYDTGLANARFTVTTTLPNGKKVIKTFRLKV